MTKPGLTKLQRANRIRTMITPSNGCLQRLLRAAIVLSFAASLAACGIAPGTRIPAATYDFGPQQAGTAAAIALVVHDAAAPAWLDSPGIVYRLAYANVAEPRIYGNSRWVSSPANLFSQRLRAAVGGLAPTDGVRADHALRVELLEFSQTFDTPDRSRGVLRLRATLSRSGALVAQRALAIERPAASNDAAGGARALSEAADAAASELATWARGAMPAR